MELKNRNMRRVCVLAREGSLYANLITNELQLNQIDFDVIWVKKGKRQDRISSLLLIPYNFYKSLSTGRFKSLPVLHWWTWWLFFSLRNQRIPEQLKQKTDGLNPLATNDYFVPSINHVKTYSILSKKKYDIGILAGVDIVDELILDQFLEVCLNAHPAPLPECRGGGALENTLLKNLKPSTSVHRVTAGIDEGDIYDVQSILLDRDDTFRSIYLKLNVLGAEMLAVITQSFLDGRDVVGIKNDGELFLWKGLTLKKQKEAHSNLKRLLQLHKKS